MSGIKVAIVGKGGSGKSVIAGTLARVLARRGRPVLALDSDPMPGLAFSLGVPPGGDAMLDGLAVRDEEAKEWRLVAEPAELVRRAARVGPDGVLFLQFGKVETSSNRPLMSSMQAFWRITQHLAADEWTIVQDLSAGTRQLFNGWAGAADALAIVVEPTAKSILSARRLIGVRDVPDEQHPEISARAALHLILNKIADPQDEALITAAFPDLPVLGSVPLDRAVAEADRLGRAPIDHAPTCPAVRAVERIAERLQSLRREGAA